MDIVSFIKNTLALDAFGLNWWQSLAVLFAGFFIVWLFVRRKNFKKHYNSTNVIDGIKSELNQSMGAVSGNNEINQPPEKEIKKDSRYKS